MSCPSSPCDKTGIFQTKFVSYGKMPEPTYVRLLARQNGQVVDVPRGYQIPAADVDLSAYTPTP